MNPPAYTGIAALTVATAPPMLTHIVVVPMLQMVISRRSARGVMAALTLVADRRVVVEVSGGAPTGMDRVPIVNSALIGRGELAVTNW
jgi:hypothetical protein